MAEVDKKPTEVSWTTCWSWRHRPLATPCAPSALPCKFREFPCQATVWSSVGSSSLRHSCKPASAAFKTNFVDLIGLVSWKKLIQPNYFGSWARFHAAIIIALAQTSTGNMSRTFCGSQYIVLLIPNADAIRMPIGPLKLSTQPEKATNLQKIQTFAFSLKRSTWQRLPLGSNHDRRPE